MGVEGAQCVEGRPESVVSGEYRTVEPYTAIEFTWNRQSEDYPESLVRWDLDDKDGYTTVRVPHSGLIGESMRARNNCWPMIVELLQVYMWQVTG